MTGLIKGFYSLALICLGVVPTLAIQADVLRGHISGITDIRFSTDGEWLASSSLDGTVRIWSTRTWKTVRVLNHGSEVSELAFSPDGRLVVSGGYDNRLMFWETKSGKLRRSVSLAEWVVALTFTPAGQLAAGSADGLARLIDPGTGIIKETINTEHEIMSLAVSNDGRHLATGYPIKLWDLESGRRLSKDIRGWGEHGLAFTPSGDRLASAEGTGGVRIWSVPTGEPLEVLRIDALKHAHGPSGSVPIHINMPATAVAFSPDGAWLATGASNFDVQLWPVTSDSVAKMPLRILSGHTMTVTGVVFSGDGRHLVSASLDRTIRIWKLQ